MYKKYDEFIETKDIFNDVNKSLDEIQKELSEFATSDMDEEKSVY